MFITNDFHVREIRSASLIAESLILFGVSGEKSYVWCALMKLYFQFFRIQKMAFHLLHYLHSIFFTSSTQTLILISTKLSRAPFSHTLLTFRMVSFRALNVLCLAAVGFTAVHAFPAASNLQGNSATDVDLSARVEASQFLSRDLTHSSSVITNDISNSVDEIHVEHKRGNKNSHPSASDPSQTNPRSTNSDTQPLLEQAAPAEEGKNWKVKLKYGVTKGAVWKAKNDLLAVMGENPETIRESDKKYLSPVVAFKVAGKYKGLTQTKMDQWKEDHRNTVYKISESRLGGYTYNEELIKEVEGDTLGYLTV